MSRIISFSGILICLVAAASCLNTCGFFKKEPKEHYHILLEVDVRAALTSLANSKDARLNKAIEMAAEKARQGDADVISVLIKGLEEMDVHPARYFGNGSLETADEISAYLHEQMDAAIDRSIEILRNRMDQYAISNYSIEKKGLHQISMELEGVTNPQNVIGIIGKTGKLEFRLLKDPETIEKVGFRINNYFGGTDGNDVTKADENDSQEVVRAEQLFDRFKQNEERTGNDPTTKSLFEKNLFLSNPNNPNVLLVPKQNEDWLRYALQDPDVQRILEEEVGNAELLIGKTQESYPYIPVYLANKEAELTGETIEDAKQQLGRSVSSIGGYEVSLNFNDEGARIFSQVTGANLQKPLAIVLDNKVQSAPIIQAKIRDGRAVITGLNTMEEAKSLMVVLRSGAFPYPLKIIEEKIIKPQ